MSKKVTEFMETLSSISRSRALGRCARKDTLQRPSFMAALRFWSKLGWISFGGTAAHIAIMHDELVEKKRWISNRSFLHSLSHCMILLGPEAQQLAIYIGWKLHGKRGGIVAGTLFVLPSMFILLALSVVYVRFGSLPWIARPICGCRRHSVQRFHRCLRPCDGNIGWTATRRERKASGHQWYLVAQFWQCEPGQQECRERSC